MGPHQFLKKWLKWPRTSQMKKSDKRSEGKRIIDEDRVEYPTKTPMWSGLKVEA